MNMHRDIMSKMNKRCDKPPVYESKVIFWDEANACQKEAWCDFLWIHEQVDYHVGKSNIEDWIGFEHNPSLESTFDGWRNRVNLSSDDPAIACGNRGELAWVSGFRVQTDRNGNFEIRSMS